MKKLLCKSKLFLLLLLLVMIPFGVNADVIIENPDAVSEECKNVANKLDSANALVNKYGLKLSFGTSNFEIKIDKTSIPEFAKKIKYKFKIAKIRGFEEDGGQSVFSYDDENIINSYILSSNKILSSSNTTLALDYEKLTAGNAHAFYVTLVPVDFTDPELYSACKDKAKFELYLDAEIGKKIDLLTEESTVERLVPNERGDSSKKIDCNGYASWDKNGFNYKFCEAREKALASGKHVTNLNQTVKCDFKDKITYDKDYYVNKTYFMTDKDIPIGEPFVYKNNYTCDNVSTKPGGQCILNCEEVVTVEYGPPAAQKAGFCFEYKVRVTSRVSCGIKHYPLTPPPEGSICTPIPACQLKGANLALKDTNRQGGPSEDFDTCVVKCDGGVYSDRCTNKCYKKVYGKAQVKNTTGKEISYTDIIDSSNRTTSSVQKVVDGAPNKYYCKGNTIIWDGGQDTTDPTNLNLERVPANDSRWHKQFLHDPNRDIYKCVYYTGIPRLCDCPEDCQWNIGSCWYGTVGNKTYIQGYMNPGEARAAYNKNVEIYNSRLNECKAAATCQTTTTTFTIGVDVGDTTYQFPYETSDKKDFFTRDSSSIKNSFSSKKTTIIPKSNIGCYGDKGPDLEYGAAWTFPGTYIKLKTGEISYDPEKKDDSWKPIPEEFCLPYNAPEKVNSKWWDYYYTMNKGITNKNHTFVNDPCKEGCGYLKRTEISEKDIEKWNIFAKTEHFGHFEWNIDIKCFYATKPPIDSKEDPVKIRSVDLANLFPDPNGSELKSSDEFGRDRGFNWTDRANNTKNSNYTSYPELYGKAVQKKETGGKSVYDESDEVDYYIHLSRNNIRNIKGIASGRKTYEGLNFVLFSDGNSSLSPKGEDSAPHYKSNFIRNNQYSTIILKPSDAAIRCNNIIGRTRCDTSLTGS